MNAAKIEKSGRLRLLADLLRAAGKRGMTSLEISAATNCVAPGTDCSELRHNGFDVECRYEGRTDSGRKVYRYVLVGVAP